MGGVGVPYGNERHDRIQTGKEPSIQRKEDEPVDDMVGLLEPSARLVKQENENSSNGHIRHSVKGIDDPTQCENLLESRKRLELQSA